MVAFILFLPILAVVGLMVSWARMDCTPPRKERDRDLYRKGVR